MGFAVWREAEELGVHGSDVIRPQAYLTLLRFALLHFIDVAFVLQTEGKILPPEMNLQYLWDMLVVPYDYQSQLQTRADDTWSPS